MQLTKIKRVNERELQFRTMLSNYRIGTPTKEDIVTALDLNILKMPADKRKEIERILFISLPTESQWKDTTMKN